MITIAKLFTFDAVHQLAGLGPDHKCSLLHGHTYGVEVRLTGIPDGRGFIMDYADLAAAWAPVHDELDHRYLNDIPGLGQPSTEVLVAWIIAKLIPVLPLLSSVRVSESSTTWAEMHC